MVLPVLLARKVYKVRKVRKASKAPKGQKAKKVKRANQVNQALPYLLKLLPTQNQSLMLLGKKQFPIMILDS